MICSFSAGAMAFAKENVVKVLVESESVTFRGNRSYSDSARPLERAIFCEKNGQNYIVYNKQIRKSNSSGANPFDSGVLFYIVCYDEAMTRNSL